MNSGDSDFTTYLEDRRARINRALTSVLDDYLAGVDSWLGEPIRYACEGGGKRFRPILFLACYEIGERPTSDRVERLAASLEIVHSYSLVHDDLPCMDDDDWRRSRATCHRVFGVERATLAAAAMVPLAGRVMASEARAIGFDADAAAAMVGELSEATGAVGMVGGQYLDLISEGIPVTLERLTDIHQRKTGALILESARLGGIAGRVSAEQLRALSEYGERIGFAFQIADDLLDERAELESGARSDQELDKATYPGLRGTARARAAAKDLAGEAIAALRSAGTFSPTLESLATHVVDREA